MYPDFPNTPEDEPNGTLFWSPDLGVSEYGDPNEEVNDGNSERTESDGGSDSPR